MEGDAFNYHAMPRKAWKLKVKVTIFSNEVIKPGQGGEKISIFVNTFFTMITTHKFASPLHALRGG